MRKKKIEEPKDIIIDGVTVMTVIKVTEEEENKIEVSDIDDLPENLIEPEKESEPISELDELKIAFAVLRQNNIHLSEEIQNLKSVKKVLSLEEVEEVVKRKNKLIKNLRTFENTLTEISDFGDFTPIVDNPIQTESFRLKIEKTSRYKEESVFSTNNILIISEAVEVVKKQIIEKVEELKTEISTIDF
jgi:hypothetical protein